MSEQEHHQPIIAAAEERMTTASKIARAMMSTMSARAALMQQPQPAASFLACNVYISAGSKPSHERILLEVLREAQSKCASLLHVVETSDEPTTTTISSSELNDDPSSSSCLPFLSTLEQKQRLPPAVMIVVHAFSDPVYNRSSIHLAGTRADAMAHVCSSLAISAIQKLQQQQQDEVQADENVESSDDNDDSNVVHTTEHPFVGFVDHVSVMPLLPPAVIEQDDDDAAADNANDDENNVDGQSQVVGDNNEEFFQPISAAGRTARAIGQAMANATSSANSDDDKLLIDKVYYYGDAHPLGTPLATVRRERTRFFQTGGCTGATSTCTNDTKSNAIDHSMPTKPQQQVATVGAPPEFVENYNIRMTQHCSKAMAQSLTRRVRERDGGLENVEALTLPYSHGRWEVACNLLRPNTSTTASDVERAVREWEERQRTAQLESGSSAPAGVEPLKLVEQGYRVGTTTEQCLQTLISCADDHEKRREHDEMVALGLKEFLQQE